MNSFIRNPAYLHWVRTHPCLIHPDRLAEAHHAGRGYMGQKAPDSTAIPLCPECHRTGKQAWHQIGRKAWQRAHGIEVEREIQRLNREYREGQ